MHAYFRLLSIIICTGFLVALLSSCKSKKNVLDHRITEVKIDSIINQLKYPPQIKFVDAKASIKFENRYQNEKGKLYLRIQQDSAILCAVKKLSVEGGRMLITPDSLFIINRIDNTYKIDNLNLLKQLYGLNPDLNYLEKMFTGLATVPENCEIKISEKEDSYLISSNFNSLNHTFIYSKTTGLLKLIHIKDRFSFDGSIKYDNYRFVNDSLALPFDREYSIKFDNGDWYEMQLSFSKLEIDAPKEIKFSIPSNYTRVY